MNLNASGKLKVAQYVFDDSFKKSANINISLKISHCETQVAFVI